MPPRPPVWPRVLGIIAIVLGSLGALSGAWGLLAPWLIQPHLPVPAEMTQWQDHWRWWMILSSVASLGLGLLLLAAGIGVLGQRRWGVRAMMAWAILRALWSLAAAAMAIPMVDEQMRAAAAQGAAPPAGFTTGIAAAGAIFTLVWGAAPAAFVLIWFTRQTIRRHIADWP